MLNIVMSCSKALCKWLQIELPLFPSELGSKGIRPINSNPQQSMWQLHYIKQAGLANHYVIAVESFSRYCMILPYLIKPSFEQIQLDIVTIWFDEFDEICQQHTPAEVSEILFEEMMQTQPQFYCYQNMDLSVQGHISDCQLWMDEYMAEHHLERLSAGDASNLSHHINSRPKKAKAIGQKQKFFPYQRLFEDGLFRFGYQFGLDVQLPDYADIPPINLHADQPLPDNVISLKDFQRTRSQ
ncbi:hypothetical protein [Paraferrimonas sp. SM1919]|uniref:hypothetical protein n=1 Tax=Paraferrimonas sp. SM1919 TaxID=2662263 RepID=UPI0013D18676|nr:hypothetical protein [Paraferrimonas sp. SM1919]